MDGANACSHIQLLTPLVSKALETLGLMPKRELQSPEELTRFTEKYETFIK